MGFFSKNAVGDTFAKIYADITESSLVMNESIPTRYLFMMLCIRSDQHGFIELSPLKMANQFNMTTLEVALGIEALSREDPESKTPDENGIRLKQLDDRGHQWLVVNKAAYRDRKNYDADKQQAYRDRRDQLQGIIADVDDFELEPPRPDTPPYEAIEQLFNATCVDLQRIKELSPARRNKIRSRWGKELNHFDKWRRFFERVQDSDFLCNRLPVKAGDRQWSADFDWLMEPKNMLKVYEGNFDNRG